MNKSICFIKQFLVCLLLLVIGTSGCAKREAPEIQSNTPLPHEVSTEVAVPTFTSLPTYYPAYQTPAAGNTSLPTSQTPAAQNTASPSIQTQTMQSTVVPSNKCTIGTGLREQTADVILKYKDRPGLIMAASSELAEAYFPQLEGWIRVIGAPSLETMQSKAERAKVNGVPYEGLGYGLETSKSTPEDEWSNLIESTRKAKELAKEYEKLLVMGPGFQLMARNEDKYTSMASMSAIWTFQTQQLQKNPPGSLYKDEVQRIVNLIRADNPDIQIWAQITFPPDREPDANEWLEYRQLIANMVDGTYIGAYTWDTASNDQLIAAIESIYQTVCGDS